ncbi:MAG TPA: glycine cleavage system protein GcvH [Halanaerobiales bacterium]|nr:glycine cleavage system protein GcvH [Halanaerobiales bacterium]
MIIPKDLYYTENHEWILIEGDEGTIGITDHAQQELGDVVFVEFPDKGDEFAQFEAFSVIESVKAVSDVYLPVGGEVVAVNEELLEQPELINEEPYEGGWLVKIRVANKEELDVLMNHEEYNRFLEEEE